MGGSLHTVTTMPTTRQPGCPFDPPTELIDARRHGPISRYTFPGGKPGWLVTGYDLVRSVLADSRFSSRKELMLHPTIDYGDLKSLRRRPASSSSWTSPGTAAIGNR